MSPQHRKLRHDRCAEWDEQVMSHAEQEMHPVVSPLTFWQRMMCRWADRIAVGRLTLQFEGYGEHVAIGATPGPNAVLCVRNASPVVRILTSGTLGFASSFINGDLDSPDIGAVLELALANEPQLGRVLASSSTNQCPYCGFGEPRDLDH